jgi:hypothetical protein
MFMTCTSRIPALLAAITLILATTAGVAAQTTATEPVSVELTDSTPNPVCTTIDLSVESGTLGVWEWDGTRWNNTSHPEGITLLHLLATFLTMPPTGCDLNIGLTQLKGTGDAVGIIPPSNFWAADSIGGPPGIGHVHADPSAWSHQGVTDPYFYITLRLETIPIGLPPGRYEGSVTITVTNTA